MKEYQVIGITQYIELPEYSKDFFPAKIDTGADDSAIWASNIRVDDNTGELSFVLFAPQSAFYTGEVIKTLNYRVAAIKNSFGVSEYRYKVVLKLRVFNKKYRVSFSLADRSHNRFPILLGKKFLKNRFVVDVSQHNVDSRFADSEVQGQKPIVVLTSRFDGITKDFFKLVEKNVSSELLVEKYSSLEMEINSNSEPKILLPDGLDIAHAGIVYFKAHSLYPEHAGAIAKYLQYKHVPFIDRELGHFVSRSKLSEMFILATNGIPVPETRIFSGKRNLPKYNELSATFGKVFVVKDVASDRGKNNYLVQDELSYSEAMSRLKGISTIMFQRYIENDGFLRVLMMGSDIVQVVERRSSEHKDPLKSHLNKPRGGVNATEMHPEDYSADIISLAQKASIAMQRSVVGVDLIQDKNTKKWYVLEVNYNPEVVRGINVPMRAKGLANLLESGNK